MKLFRKKSNPLYEDSSSDDITGTRILVIDDEEYICELIRTILEKEGCVVDTVNNGNEAMQQYSTASYDVVITDMAMPGKDGVETIIEIRQLHPPVGIVAISGVDARSKLLSLAAAFDADVSLKKPFTKKELVAAVKLAKRKKLKSD